MNDKEQDPNLQAPQEANTTKHINFLDIEATDADETGKESNDDSPTKKAWEELRNENKKKSNSTE